MTINADSIKAKGPFLTLFNQQRVGKSHFTRLMLIGLLCGSIQPGWATVCPTSTLEQLDLPNRTAFKPTALRQLDSKGTFHALVVFSRFQNENNGSSAVPGFAHQIFDPQHPGSLTHFYLEMFVIL